MFLSSVYFIHCKWTFITDRIDYGLTVMCIYASAKFLITFAKKYFGNCVTKTLSKKRLLVLLIV